MQQSNPLAAGAAATFLMVSPTTLAVGSAAMEQECLVARLVGRLIVRPQGNVGGSAGIGILKGTGGVVFGGFNDPLVPAELGIRDWLWTQNMSWNTNSLANGHTFIRDFDIRVKRKLETTEGIYVVWSNIGGGDAITIEIDARIVIIVRL